MTRGSSASDENPGGEEERNRTLPLKAREERAWNPVWSQSWSFQAPARCAARVKRFQVRGYTVEPPREEGFVLWVPRPFGQRDGFLWLDGGEPRPQRDRRNGDPLTATHQGGESRCPMAKLVTEP